VGAVLGTLSAVAFVVAPLLPGWRFIAAGISFFAFLFGCGFLHAVLNGIWTAIKFIGVTVIWTPIRWLGQDFFWEIIWKKIFEPFFTDFLWGKILNPIREAIRDHIAEIGRVILGLILAAATFAVWMPNPKWWQYTIGIPLSLAIFLICTFWHKLWPWLKDQHRWVVVLIDILLVGAIIATTIWWHWPVALAIILCLLILIGSLIGYANRRRLGIFIRHHGLKAGLYIVAAIILMLALITFGPMIWSWILAHWQIFVGITAGIIIFCLIAANWDRIKSWPIWGKIWTFLKNIKWKDVPKISTTIFGILFFISIFSTANGGSWGYFWGFLLGTLVSALVWLIIVVKSKILKAVLAVFPGGILFVFVVWWGLHFV